MRNFDNGKVPPSAIEAEETVLGALLLDNSVMHKVISMINRNSFYSDAHAHVWDAITTLTKNSNRVDLITVKDQLNKSGKLEEIGGPLFLAQLTNKVASTANIEFHAAIIQQKAIARDLITINYESVKKLYEGSEDTFEVMFQMEAALLNITQENSRGNVRNITEIAQETRNRIEKAAQSETKLIGVPSGIQDLDKLTGGWMEDDLIIVAGRPGMGKTSLALSFGKNAALDFKKPVAVFSMEMGAVQLFINLLSMETQITNTKIKHGDLSGPEHELITAAERRYIDSGLHIDDTPALSIIELRSKCLSLKAQKNIGLFIVDYLGLMNGTDRKQSTLDRISEISRNLKLIAKETKTPVIALAQLSRDVEKRGGDKRPMLSDLRDSGSIEQDADIVIFPYRPEYYGILEDGDGRSLEGIAELIVAKHRGGATDTIVCEFVDRTTTFRDQQVKSVNYKYPEPPAHTNSNFRLPYKQEIEEPTF